MSHSVFRDLDDNSNCGNYSKGVVADNNIVVFIDKNGDVSVDPNALQDLVVGANTDNSQSTVSVIRVGSPTPSMESNNENNSDQDKNRHEEESNTEDKSESEGSDECCDNGPETKEAREMVKKKKKNKARGVSLTVEEFYNPQQAVELATKIMTIAGITNPKQLKADYEHLRYIIQNDHCYTPYTYSDSLNDTTTTTKSEATSSAKALKSNTKAAATSTTNILLKKHARNQSKSHIGDTSDSKRKKSVEDTNSSMENIERTSDEEEVDSETDFSDFSEDESDNDRDSDLDFSVNDCHSRRAKKIKKKKQQAKRLANRKRRQSTIDNNGSDDGLVPNRKKVSKVLKKTSNINSKPTNTPIPTVSSSLRSPVASSTPRLTKLTKADVIHSTESSTSTITESVDKINTGAIQIQESVSGMSKASPIIQKTTITSTTTFLSSPNANHSKSMILMRQRMEKKSNTDNQSYSGAKTLFTPTVVKKVPHSTNQVVSKAIPILAVGMNRQAIAARATNTQPVLLMSQHIPKQNVLGNKQRDTTVKLESEQDKQLDLIDSLVQEELSKSDINAKTPISTQNDKLNFNPAAIPSIVKMLETPEARTPMGTSDLASMRTQTTISFDTAQSAADSQILPDDLLESFVNSDDCLTDDLMQHVVKLVEDKNLQEVIDKQVLGVGSIAPSITTTNLSQSQNPSTSLKSNIFPARIQISPEIVSDEKSVNNPSHIKKEPIIIKRSNGQIITLPPIEAPATRGAKRRAECTTSTNDQQKPKIITVIVQTEARAQPKTVSNIPVTTNQETKLENSESYDSIKPKPITPRERRASVAVKRTSFDSKPKRSMSISNPPATHEEDEDDDDDGSDGSYNSEDDPHRLWCICRTPHNNRFMICCDKCEDWFHGKCVGVNKSMGAEIEKRGVEWICPNCIKKQQPSIKNIFPRKSLLDNTTKLKEAGTSSSFSSTSTLSGALSTPQTIATQSNCIVCNAEASRNNSVYCSDNCIRKHASTAKVNVTSAASVSTIYGETTTPTVTAAATTTSNNTTSKVNQTTPEVQRKQIKLPTQSLFKDKSNHVVCIEKATGKYLTGKMAPTTENLQKWLDEHPEYEVLKPGTPQANAFKAKQLQLKTLARNMEAEKELFSVSQPVKVQTTLRFNESDKKMVYGLANKPATAPAGVKRPITMTSPSSNTSTKLSLANRSMEPITKTPKLSVMPIQKSNTVKKRLNDEPKTLSTTKSDSGTTKSSGERDQIRENARKTLIEQLIIRTKEIGDPNAIKLTENEINAFVKVAEAEMFAMFGNDTNTKYKAKYRSLMFNIKDRKNRTLIEKISNKMIEPKQLVRLSPEELASQELAKWRENENKHQLEMITKSELDMLACGKSYVLKTHKGEEVIQEGSERISLDPSISVQDVVSILNNSTVSSSSEVGDDSSSIINPPIIVKDNRYDKYLNTEGGSSTLVKKDTERNYEKKDRNENRSSTSSSKHKRKRSRERHSSHSSHSSHSHKEKNRDNDKKERNSSESRKDKKEHKTSSKHDSNNKDKKQKKKEPIPKKILTTSKIQKTEDNSISDKIRKAQTTINSILHPEEFKKSSEKTNTNETPSEAISFIRQTTTAIESDQEPTSTVTIPTPPECTPEPQSSTPPLVGKSVAPIIWSGTINMVDVATFQVSLSVLSGNTTNIPLNTDLDVVGRIRPDIVWDYLEKIRVSKDISLLRFTPQSGDDANAYETFLNYLDERRRLGVFEQTSKLIKDFYVLPLPAHAPLPNVLKKLFNTELEQNRPALLIGIIVKNKSSAPLPAKTVSRQCVPFSIGQKPTATVTTKEVHYTPPSSPNINIVQTVNKTSLKSFPTNLDDDEPYSPGGSDEDDLNLPAIPPTFLSSTTPTPLPTVSVIGPSENQIQREVEELNRQIEAEKKQIAMHLQSADITNTGLNDLNAASNMGPVWDSFGRFSGTITKDNDEPYSPSNSVSPPMNANLSDVVSKISIPANLADILQNVASFGTTPSNQMQANQYITTPMDVSDEYVPIATASTSAIISYGSAVPMNIQSTSTSVASEPSKLAQLTDEELLRLVPDEIEY